MTSSDAAPIDLERMTEQLLKEIERTTKSSDMAARIATNRIKVAVGQTPKEQIWALNKMRLYHYYPQVPPEQRKPVPLLLVFALINRPYIFDLRPGNSFVEYMLKHGYEVYLLDWGTPVRKTLATISRISRSSSCPALYAQCSAIARSASFRCSAGASVLRLSASTPPCAPMMACAT